MPSKGYSGGNFEFVDKPQSTSYSMALEKSILKIYQNKMQQWEKDMGQWDKEVSNIRTKNKERKHDFNFKTEIWNKKSFAYHLFSWFKKPKLILCDTPPMSEKPDEYI